MKRFGILITVPTVVIVLMALNLFFSRHSARLDLTDDKIYTLSPSTKEILGKLKDVVTVNVYFSEDLPPALEFMRRNVEDMLSEFKKASHGNMSVNYINPSESVVDEQKVEMMGIPPLQLNVIEQDKQQVAKIYLGMVVMYGDKSQVIPVVKKVESFEYDLAEAIVKVSSEKLPPVAIWTGKSENTSYEYVKTGLSRRYDVTGMNDSNIADLAPSKFSTLILISPGKLSDAELSAIDGFLSNGGKLIALIDTYDISPSLTAAKRETNAPDLLKRYGIEIADGLVLDQSNAMAAFSGGPVTYHLPYAFWPDVRKEQFTADSPITSALETLVLPWTSPLNLSSAAEPSTQTGILASSTQDAVLAEGKEIQLDPQSANEGLIKGKRGRLVLAALAKGQVLVVGSSRWVSDQFLETFPANVEMFENAVDYFAMGNELIGIRSRENTSRPIDMITDGQRAFIKYLNLVLGPFIIAAIGLVTYALRRVHIRKRLHLLEKQI
jgi:gliding-associated putative ABC transporter substrate-binding component GldG